MNSLKLNLIAAACENMGIGYKNDLPWRLKNEMGYFTRMTLTAENLKQNAVLMGRRTWDAVPEKYRPFSGRVNIVLSRSEFNGPEGVHSYKGWEDVMADLETSQKYSSVDKVWVIGGSAIYKAAIESPHCHRIYLTRILKNFECDVFFPAFDEAKFKLVRDPDVPEEEQEENGIKYRFEVYERLK